MTPIGKKRLQPGSRIRTLVVDDSAAIRKMLTNTLGDDPELEVVGSVSDGVAALDAIPQVKPDIVTLDIEMPRMDGLETLRQIRKLHPELPVIMFSSLSERGAAITIEALASGANDYVTKAQHGGPAAARLGGELIPKLKQFFVRTKDTTARAVSDAPAVARPRPALQKTVACRAVGIAVSTGGPNALAEVIQMLPAKFQPPILIVQHMPPIFTRLLAERLQVLTKLKVQEASDGMVVEPGHVYIAPGDFHMQVVRQGFSEIIKLSQGEPENSCRPAADVLLRSIAAVYGAHAVGVVLTGMGRDGMNGMKEIRAAGGYVVAQDEASSVVWGMPGAVVAAGLADVVLDLRSIVGELEKRL